MDRFLSLACRVVTEVGKSCLAHQKDEAIAAIG